ncbi:MAG: ester cyclase [Spirochaetes bacterium]|nr:ester cyclase [Spirochaetota bacterium]
MTSKETAVAFLRETIAGNTDAAFEAFIHRDFKHHNPFYKSSAHDLRSGMADSFQNIPDKQLEIGSVTAENDMATVHARLVINGEITLSAVYIFRFKDAKIIELWDIVQQVPEDSVNELGMFWRK